MTTQKHTFLNLITLSTAIFVAFSGTSYADTKAVRIIFKQGAAGSFDAALATGTVNTPGSGHKVVRLFGTDNSQIASGNITSSSWPKWLVDAEIGISGASNTAANNANCARFATTTEINETNCDWNASGIPANRTKKCGTEAYLYRISEYDCAIGTTTLGNGGPNDGIYIRVTLDRTQLGASENIMATLQYSANFLNPAPTDPTKCYTQGRFSPETAGCADMAWQMYLKHNASEVVQPFLMLTPPATAMVTPDTTDATNARGGGGIAQKQFFLPLAADANLKVFQLSRIFGINQSSLTNPDWLRFKKTCAADGANPANSPNCLGMVFYTLTLFRM